MDMILILNYSNEFSMEMAKRLRAEHVYAKIVGSNITAEEVRKLAPKGIILSGEAKDFFRAFPKRQINLLEGF